MIIIIMIIFTLITSISLPFLSALPKTLSRKLENVQVPALPDSPNPNSVSVCVCICMFACHFFFSYSCCCCCAAHNDIIPHLHKHQSENLTQKFLVSVSFSVQLSSVPSSSAAQPLYVHTHTHTQKCPWHSVTVYSPYISYISPTHAYTLA